MVDENEVKQPSLVLSSSVLSPLADHCPVIVQLSFKKSRPPKPYVFERFLYHSADADGLGQALASSDWNATLAKDSVHDAAVSWSTVFMSACRKFVPQFTVRVDPVAKLRFSRYLRYLASCRDRLFKRSRRQNSDSPAMIAFRRVRNLFVSELRAAERRFFSQVGSKLLAPDLNPHRWWKLAKKACGWSSSHQLLALSVNGNVITSPSEQSSILNEQFSRQCSASPPAAILSCPFRVDTVEFLFDPLGQTP